MLNIREKIRALSQLGADKITFLPFYPDRQTDGQNIYRIDAQYEKEQLCY